MENKKPYFLQVMGCRNCDTLIFNDIPDSERINDCITRGCFGCGYNFMKPFIDPREVVDFVTKIGSSELKEQAETYLKRLIKFKEGLKEKGVSIEKLLEELNCV